MGKNYPQSIILETTETEKALRIKLLESKFHRLFQEQIVVIFSDFYNLNVSFNR